MGRPIGSETALPTKKYQRELIERLKKKVEEKDDTLAMGLLLILCELKKPY